MLLQKNIWREECFMDAPMMRSLPQSIEAEQSVIGAMLIDKTAIAKVFEKLEEEDFYRDGHKVIYKAIREMYAKDMAVDLVTLLEHLKSADMLEKAGGVTYISELSASVPTTANLSSYIKIVEEKSTLRKLIKTSTAIIEESYNNGGDVEKVIDIAQKKIFDLAENKDSKEYEPLSAVLERGFLEIERLFNNKGEITGVGSGIKDLDAKTSGFQKGDMVLIAARPSMGKTTFSLNIAENAALKEGKSVVIFSCGALDHLERPHRTGKCNLLIHLPRSNLLRHSCIKSVLSDDLPLLLAKSVQLRIINQTIYIHKTNHRHRKNNQQKISSGKAPALFIKPQNHPIAQQCQKCTNPNTDSTVIHSQIARNFQRSRNGDCANRACRIGVS